MTSEERSLITYRMSRAHEAIEEAKLLFNAGHINSYVNRLYYACFYADLVVFKADEVAEWLAQTKAFVSHIETLISKME
jgi:uncharacterized protein (UPF0332 family)